MADVFISHSERDRDVADQLAAFLLGIGRSVWWDPDHRAASICAR